MATTSADQEIVELQTQLAVAVAARDQAIGDRNQAYLAGKAAERGNCSFLEKLPIEIRNEVYRLLLVNDVLATNHVLSVYRPHAQQQQEQYGLHPTILRTCRQIHDEHPVFFTPPTPLSLT